jgi:Glycosyl hydrolase family 26
MTITRRDFLELGGKGLAAAGAASVGAGLLTSGCQTIAPPNETGPVNYPRLAGQKIQSPEHYGMDGCMTGLWVLGFRAKLSDAQEMERKVGKPFSISMVPYHETSIGMGITERWTRHVLEPIVREGTIPFVTFDCSFSQFARTERFVNKVVEGAYDQDIVDSAKQLTKFGEQHGGLFIRTMREMNMNFRKKRDEWPPWGGYPDKFIDAWIHIWNIFEAEGANQYATWVWNPHAGRTGTRNYTSRIERYYPGDQYVDWIGLGSYNHASSSNHGYQSFKRMFQPAYNLMRTAHPSKPIMITDTATMEGYTKSEWVKAAFASAKSEFPGVKSLGWWSERFSHGGMQNFDARIDSSPEALQAFKESISDPYFLGKVPYRDLKA